MPTTRAVRRAVSACTGTSRSRCRARSSRPRRWPGLYSVGAAMAATGRALDWFRDEIVGGDVTTERLLEEAAATPPGADGLVFLPYLAGERSPIWDPTRDGRVRRPDPRPRPRPPRPGDPRGERPRDPPRRDADARGRGDRHGDARLRRPGAERRLEPDQGRRHRLPGRSCRPCSRPRSSARRSSARWRRGAPDLPSAIRAMTRIDRRSSRGRSSAPTYDRLFAAYTALYPAIAPVLGRWSATSRRPGMRAADVTEPAADPRRRRRPVVPASAAAAAWRSSTASTSRSPAAGSWRSSAPTAAASRRSCASIAGLLAPDRGAVTLDGAADRRPRTRGSGSCSRSRGCCRGGRPPTTSPTRSSSPAGRPTRRAAAPRRARRSLSGSTRASAATARPSCPAARASAWRWPAPWRSSPRCSCSTSRSARSTR